MIEDIAQNDNDSLRMTLGFDDVTNLFVLAWLEEKRCIFQVKMTPETFEKLTTDMIRVVKNYNLAQALKYKEEQEKKNGEKETERTETKTDMVDSNEENSGVEGSSLQPENIDQVHGGEAETVV
jgi:hypothetical protein